MILLDDVFVYINEDMPDSITEAVSPNSDGTYTILLNGNLSTEVLRKAFFHAIEHIEHNDFERVETYGIQNIENHAYERNETNYAKIDKKNSDSRNFISNDDNIPREGGEY